MSDKIYILSGKELKELLIDSICWRGVDKNHKERIGYLTCSIEEYAEELMSKDYTSYEEITQKRLDAITIEQWRKWAKKYNISYSTGSYIDNSSCDRDDIEYFYMYNNQYKIYIDGIADDFNDPYENVSDSLLKMKGLSVDQFNYFGKAKAIHELVDELEAM